MIHDKVKLIRIKVLNVHFSRGLNLRLVSDYQRHETKTQSNVFILQNPIMILKVKLVTFFFKSSKAFVMYFETLKSDILIANDNFSIEN